MTIHLESGYYISDDKSLLDLNTIHQYLSMESYWAQGIPMDVVRRSVDGSMCFGVYLQDKQVGFARLITDKATFAYLADVFILPLHRGNGLSKSMMETIHAHPELQGLRRWMLGTRDAHELYRRFGLQEITEEQRPRFMQLHFPAVYNPANNK